MKFFKLLLLLLASHFIFSAITAQVNPYISVLPANSGLVNLGSTLDLQITIGNTGSVSVPAAKLRPIITVPSIVSILPNAQQTLPNGWTIVSNMASQIRICNGSDVIAGNTSRTIIIKIEAVSIGGPSTFSGQINYGGSSCNAAGPAPNGNTLADDFATSSLQVAAGCSLNVSANANTILCNGGSATVTATGSGITGSIEYKISNSGSTINTPYQTSNIFTNIPAGTYTVSARDAANPISCQASANLTIIEPSALAAPVVNIIQPTCSNANGTVTINSPTTGLNFSLDGGTFIPYPVGGFALSAGNHSIQATNVNNCLSPIVPFSINAQPVTPNIPIVGTITQPNCSVSTGSVVLNGLPAGNWTVNPGGITGNTSTVTLNNLAAGNYNFTVTNAVGCVSLSTSAVTLNAVVDAPTAPAINIVQPSCTVATGAISVSSSITGLIFSLNGSAYAPYPAGGYTGLLAGSYTLIGQNVSGCLSPLTNFTINTQPQSPALPTIAVTQPTCTVATGTINITSSTTGLTVSFDGGAFGAYPVGGYVTTAGTHTIAVQNISGCSPTLQTITVNPQPTSPMANASATAITCFGGSSTVTVSATGAVSPYEYSLNNGPFQTSNTFLVNAGTYAFTVKDANGCTGSISSFNITQPAIISATTTTGSIACKGGTTTLTINASGGNGAYEYKLNNGSYQSANTFNVPAGNYAATVRLVANPTCLTQISTPIIVAQPDSLKAKANAKAIETCGGNTEVEVSATGGTLPYTGTGKFTRGPDTWQFSVTDAKGCNTITQVVIVPPGCLELKVYPIPAQNSITVNHTKADKNAAIQIYSEAGALVINKTLQEGAIISILNVSNLPSGVYLIVYYNEDERKTTRFVKSNSK
jgi:hypothetical protein